MISTYLHKERDVILKEHKRDVQDDEVLVRIHSASICDSDKLRYQNVPQPKELEKASRFLGHEGGGYIEEVGKKVREFKPGDAVMIFGSEGSLSDYFVYNVERIQRVPDSLDMEIACLGEPLSVPMYGIYKSGIQPGDTVAVFGLGINGQVCVQAARLRGATTVIAVDCFEGKLELAKNVGKADFILNMKKKDVLAQIAEITKGKGVDVVIETSGYGHPEYEELVRLETESTRHNGIYVMIGWPSHPIRVDMHRWHHHGLDVRVVALRHHSRQWEMPIIERVLRPYQQGLVNVYPLINGRYSLKNVKEAFEDLDRNSNHVKVVVKP